MSWQELSPLITITCRLSNFRMPRTEQTIPLYTGQLRKVLPCSCQEYFYHAVVTSCREYFYHAFASAVVACKRTRFDIGLLMFCMYVKSCVANNSGSVGQTLVHRPFPKR